MRSEEEPPKVRRNPRRSQSFNTVCFAGVHSNTVVHACVMHNLSVILASVLIQCFVSLLDTRHRISARLSFEAS